MESDEDEYDSFDVDDEGDATKQGSAPKVERPQGYLDLTIRHSSVVRQRWSKNASSSLAAGG